MPVIYQHQPDEVVPQAATIAFDEGGWWAEVQLNGAILALAASIVASTASRVQASQVFNWWQDDPAGNLTATVDEYFWQNPNVPINQALWYPQQGGFDEQTPALSATVDEYFWTNPNQPIALGLVYPQQWAFDDQTPALVSLNHLDEDFWYGAPLPNISLTNLWTQQWNYEMVEIVPQGQPGGVIGRSARLGFSFPAFR